MSRTGALPLAAAVLAAGAVAVACATSSISTQPQSAAVDPAMLASAVAYLRAHAGPAPSQRGVVAGIVMAETVTSTMWWQTLVIASGSVITIRCGSIPHPCMWGPPFPLGAAGGLGSYEFVPADGNADTGTRFAVVKFGAVQ
jgi:hypothetical protein